MEKNIKHPYPKQIFILGNDEALGKKIAEYLQMEESPLTIRKFPDGEKIPHQKKTVRGRDVFIILTSQNGEETDRWLMDYLRFIWSVKAGDPYKITVVIPKLPHQRQDVEDQDERMPAMTNFFPELALAAGANHMVVCKLHNPASKTKNPPMSNIDTTKLLIEDIEVKYPDRSKIVIATGDMGGSKYGRKIADALGVPLIITEKNRNPISGATKVMKVYTDGVISETIDTVIFVDDLISTFGTLRKAADALSDEYPQIVNYEAYATHPDFGEDTATNMIESRFNSICVMDTVPVSEEFLERIKLSGKKLSFISVAKYIAQTIDNLHNGQSVSDLWKVNGKQAVSS